ncbi:MAG TPA: hypothetical protein VFG03_13140 [Telluria sp.]|nr:hypothetical protein [Telluria sp.]
MPGAEAAADVALGAGAAAGGPVCKAGAEFLATCTSVFSMLLSRYNQ